MISIRAIGVYVPETCLPPSRFVNVAGFSESGRKTFECLEIETVSVAEGLSSIDLALKGAQLALAMAGIGPVDLDVIIHLQSRVPRYLMSSEATQVQERLGASGALAFTLSGLGCADISNALFLGRQLLKANERYRNILIACGSKSYGVSRYRPGVTLLGDAGMGVILSREPGHQLLDVRLKSDGRFWDLFRVDYENKRFDDLEETPADSRYAFELAVMSRNVFRELNRELLQANAIETPDHYIMQNLSPSSLSFYEHAFDIRFLPICKAHCVRFGHLGSIDVMHNYHEAVKQGAIQHGNTTLIMNNSPAACWSSILLRA